MDDFPLFCEYAHIDKRLDDSAFREEIAFFRLCDCIACGACCEIALCEQRIFPFALMRI